MSRLHDALRKAALETDQPPSITEIHDAAVKPNQVSRDSESLRRAGKVGLLDRPYPSDGLQDSGASLQSDGCELAQEKVVSAEEEGDVFRAFGRDPALSHGKRSRLDPGELAREQIVKLVQRLFVFPNSRAPRLIVFSSVDKANGSSEICLRTGQVLATHVSGSVCLVDGNLRGPLLHRLLGVDRFPELTDASVRLDSTQDFAVRVAGTNLWVVPPDSPELESSDMFASDQLWLRMAELREKFDYVLIDAPPITSCADAVLLGQKADGLILVVEAHCTRRETARKAKETLQDAKVNLLGAVLNNRTFPIPEALYHKL